MFDNVKGYFHIFFAVFFAAFLFIYLIVVGEKNALMAPPRRIVALFFVVIFIGAVVTLLAGCGLSGFELPTFGLENRQTVLG
jgi:hypothetical protein